MCRQKPDRSRGDATPVVYTCQNKMPSSPQSLSHSHWDRLPIELKAKIARMAAFPVGDFEILETGLKVYWSELRYQGKVFDLDTGEEVDPRHGLTNYLKAPV